MSRRIVKGGLVQVRGKQRGGTLLRKKKYVYEEERFVILCVHDNKIPLLEWYEEDRDRWNHTPLKVLDLLGCHSVNAVIGEPRCFCVSFADDDRPPIELAASSEEQCSDWISHLTDALQKLDCLGGNGECGEERYGEFPGAPPIENTEAVSERSERSRSPPRTCHQPTKSASIPIKIPRSVLDQEITLSNPSPSLPSTSLDISPNLHRLNVSPHSLPNHSRQHAVSVMVCGGMSTLEFTPPGVANTSHELNGRAERSANDEPPLTPPPLPPRRSTPAQRNSDPSSPPCVDAAGTTPRSSLNNDQGRRTTAGRIPIDQYDILPNSTDDERERPSAESQTEPKSRQEAEFRSAGAGSEDMPGKAQESPHRNDVPSSQVPATAKNNQVASLIGSRESSHYDHLPKTVDTVLPRFETLPRPRAVSLLKSLCIEHIAFVEMGNRIWIAGWSSRMDCHLRGIIHVGDEILRIGGTAPRSMDEFVTLLHSQALPGAPVRLKIAATPFGVVRSLKIPSVSSANEGSKLDIHKTFGMQVKKNQVIAVEARSAAAEAGISTHLPPYLYSATGHESRASITELNSIPLNPFARGEQIPVRIQSLLPNSTLTIILHPTDFVTSLNERLKGIKGYKNFLHQPTLESDH